MGRLLLGALAVVAGVCMPAQAPLASAGEDLNHNPRGGDSCIASVHVVGRKWVFKVAARRSAIRAWEREVRYIHGGPYAVWESASGQSIECKRVDALFQRCEAEARPCRS